MPIDGESRIWLVALEHQLHRLAGGVERRVAQIALGKDRRESGGDEKHIPVAQRHFELLGEMQEHLAARLGAAGFEETQVTGRDVCLAGEVELAHAPAQAPVAQVIADGSQGR